ncbi:unnamed protein product [Trypanosoma congolense IL3000]|uniref:WGS project CAEQ00000000 data, annotated contig 872 n=1 Tax=Trypanosoma congolense (strain IL3000) TaxID=1068625 RepID=F9WJ45_TRYCI|nr:unnamed protein product [Trypanosoma congolense IL3000]
MAHVLYDGSLRGVQRRQPWYWPLAVLLLLRCVSPEEALAQAGASGNEVSADGAQPSTEVAQYGASPAGREELSNIYHRAVRALYEKSNLTEAVVWIKKGAALGHGRLHWLLGVMHSNGVGVPQSDAHAVLHYKFAALEGVPEAHMALGARYRDGVGAPRSCQLAAFHLREAANSVAMTRDGLPNSTGAVKMQMLFKGNTDDTNSEEAVHALMYRADGGATAAIIALGYMYLKGHNGRPRDWYQARSYFLKALEAGDPAAYGALGRLYAFGDDSVEPTIERDLAAAASYFSEGAVKNEPTSLNGMGYMHAIGYYENDKVVDEPGMSHPPDFKTAAEYFEKSATRGNVEAMYNLGVLKLHGRGVPHDPASAVKLFEDAAVRGSVLSIWQLARHAEIRGDCQRATAFYDYVASQSPIFYNRGVEPYLPTEKGIQLAPMPGNSLVTLLESLAFAETGHSKSRHEAVKVLSDIFAEEDTGEEVLDEVFAKSGKPPEQTTSQVNKAAAYLLWHRTVSQDVNQVAVGGPSALRKAIGEGGNATSRRMLLSQREALSLLKLRLLELSAISGSAEAELRLGDFHYYGESRLIGVNMVKALIHYEVAAGQGNAKALFNAGFMYQLGLGMRGSTRQPEGVWDAFLGIINNFPVGTVGSSRSEGGGALQADPLTVLERRLYVAKRFYDHVSDVDRGLGFYAVKFALTSLNFQWWWLYFSRQRYGLSRTLGLSMPCGSFENPPVLVTGADGASQQNHDLHENHPMDGGIVGRSQGQQWWWDDYLLAASVAVLFVCLLLRHHGA